MYRGYTRVSTTEQADDGKSSLPDQERQIRGLTMMRDAEAFALYCDAGVSGSTPLANRPEGSRLLAELVRGDTLVAAKLDRLFRSARDALECAEKFKRDGIDLILIDAGAEPVTGSGTSKLFFTMLAAFAEFERTRILERIADGKRGKLARGGYAGGLVPYGWRVEGAGRAAMLMPDPGEQVIVSEVIAARECGMTYQEIADHLNARDHRTRTGKPFIPTQIRRITLTGEGLAHE